MIHYQEKDSEIWAYDGTDFIGKLYPVKDYWVWNPALGRNYHRYGGSTSNFFTAEQAKRYIEDPHQVEQDFVGLTYSQRLTCYTCGETLLQRKNIRHEQWRYQVKQFLEKHPCTLTLAED